MCIAASSGEILSNGMISGKNYVVSETLSASVLGIYEVRQR